jgi:outer membrane protein OmpA-like peptidoglycan-associated protein
MATTALALAAITMPMVPAHAAAPFDGTWIIDVPADSIKGDGGNPACPALRLRVQITDNQVTGNFRRVAPGEANIVENGGRYPPSDVIGNVQPDGGLTAQWQNFHDRGKLLGDKGVIAMQSECGPLIARAWRLNDETTITSASSGSQGASSTTNGLVGYNVYFNWDKSTLTGTGNNVVSAAVNSTQKDRTNRVALIGKADLSGTDPYNMALSHRRADTVHDALVAGGVPADRIDVRWDGDRNPPVPTAAGVRDAQNRVVEVAIR